jgi:hypothetical protein
MVRELITVQVGQCGNQVCYWRMMHVSISAGVSVLIGCVWIDWATLLGSRLPRTLQVERESLSPDIR